MNFRRICITTAVAPLLLLSACHRTPDHAKYIPKNALMVAELNTKELAWNILTGTNFWERIIGRKKSTDTSGQNEFVKNMQEAGVDELNTFYAYLKNTGGKDNDACIVALIPLKNAMKWESFVKKTFPEAQVKENKKRKEARLSESIYVGWTNNLMILISLQKGAGFENLDDYNGSALSIDDGLIMASYMESAFNISEENTLLQDKRFAKFEQDKHDLGFWVNMDDVMDEYGSKNLGMMAGGLTLSDNMWRNSAFSVATHFEKGKMTADIVMYSSDAMKDINAKYSSGKMDPEMVKRIPNEGLDYLLAYKMSPEGTLKSIEKMGVLGIANGFLKEQNLSVEEILGSISGDLVLAMNNYRQISEQVLFDSTDESSLFTAYKQDMDVTMAMKVANKASLKKIFDLAVKLDVLENPSQGIYVMKKRNAFDSSLILLTDEYAIYANKNKLATAYANGTYAKENQHKMKSLVNNQPFGMFFDFSHWSQGVKSSMTGNKGDSLIYDASTKTFENIVFNGGTHSNNAFKYQLSVNFVNKNENSLVQLLEFSKNIREADRIKTEERAALLQEYLQNSRNDSTYYE